MKIVIIIKYIISSTRNNVFAWEEDLVFGEHTV